MKMHYLNQSHTIHLKFPLQIHDQKVYGLTFKLIFRYNALILYFILNVFNYYVLTFISIF